jgi:hypothetical protein
MINMCSFFDPRVKNELVYGGKVLNFPMLNATYFLYSASHFPICKSLTLESSSFLFTIFTCRKISCFSRLGPSVHVHVWKNIYDVLDFEVYYVCSIVMMILTINLIYVPLSYVINLFVGQNL